MTGRPRPSGRAGRLGSEAIARIVRRSLTRVTRLVSLATIAGCVAIGIAAEPLLHLVTPGFESGANALKILLCAAALSSLAGFNLALVEYTLILGLVTVVSITALSALGGSITALLQAVTSALNTVI